MKYILITFIIGLNSWLFALDGAVLIKQHCSQCHLEDGNSEKENIPKIAGFSAILLFDMLDQFKHSDRSSPKMSVGDYKDKKTTDMTEISKQLKQDEMETIALFLSEQTFKPASQPFDKALAATGKQLHQDLCNDCHGENGTSAVDDAPILAGQWKAYLKRQFEQLSSHKRHMPKRMKRKFRKLNDEDKQALLEFYASRKP